MIKLDGIEPPPQVLNRHANSPTILRLVTVKRHKQRHCRISFESGIMQSECRFFVLDHDFRPEWTSENKLKSLIILLKH